MSRWVACVLLMVPSRLGLGLLGSIQQHVNPGKLLLDFVWFFALCSALSIQQALLNLSHMISA